VEELKAQIASQGRNDFDALLALAQSNHVIVRGLEAFLALAREAQDEEQASWARASLAAERSLIEIATHFLHEICAAFEENKLKVVVIKSLDHWPDLGSDLDLFTDADAEQVIQLMHGRFGAEIEQRSWGDRLAHKWNFHIPGLPEYGNSICARADLPSFAAQ